MVTQDAAMREDWVGGLWELTVPALQYFCKPKIISK